MTTTGTLQARMAEAAVRLLDALDAERRPKVQFASVFLDEREQWFYTPTDHGGLRMQYMTSPQQRETLRLVATGYSARGFVTAAMIMAMENILDARDRMRAAGARILGDGEPKTGAHGKPVLFLHPKDFLGTLVELEQA